VTREYTPSTPMQWVFEHTSVFARASPAEIGTTQTTSDGNFLSSTGNVIGLQLSIPLAYRKAARDGLCVAELRPTDPKAMEEARALFAEVFGQ
jgi:hypothetical protein